MALWGNNDNIGIASINALVETAAGVVSVTSAGVVSGSVGVHTFTNLEAGDVITVGQGQTGGFGVIVSIASSTSMTISTTAIDNGNWDAGNDYDTSYMIFSEQPISAEFDPAFAPSSSNAQRGYTSKVYGISEDNLGTTGDGSDTSRTGVGGQLLNAVAHAGWVGVTTYLDFEGNLRTKAEVLVAGSGIQTGNRAYPPA